MTERLPLRLSELYLYSVPVSLKTRWIFLVGRSIDGLTGFGEVTLQNQDTAIVDATRELPGVITHATLQTLQQRLPLRVGYVLASAVEQIWLDIQGQEQNVSTRRLLEIKPRSKVLCYANINRGTIDRTPNSFTTRAEEALTLGFSAVKIAPFDEVLTQASDQHARSDAIDIGMARVEAVMRVSGDHAVQVDCHSRFQLNEANQIIARLGQLGVQWIEEPVVETAETIPKLEVLRATANRHGALLAGAEKFSGLDQFQSFIDTGAYDVIMPDIRFCGGFSEAIRIAKYADLHGTQVSPHNPCGPVMAIVSAQMAACLPSLHSLEIQYAESPLFDKLLSTSHQLTLGHYELAEEPGHGISLSAQFNEYARKDFSQTFR
ncbi:MAG TPA: hypothetical protein EYQ32_14330 [Gammaproteobacteria bacterium]|nr:hypothetical protein [Gammaproteobacteria bacterium]